jgi:hypothetical protein
MAPALNQIQMPVSRRIKRPGVDGGNLFQSASSYETCKRLLSWHGQI